MNSREIKAGLLFALMHFLLEVTSFYIVSQYVKEPLAWVYALTYDFFAFVPQGIYGYLRDTFLRRIDFAVIGTVFTSAALLFLPLHLSPFVVIFVLSLGNCLVHIHGAEESLRVAAGRITPASFFVSGGSFGLIAGRLLAKAACPMPIILVLNLVIIALSILAKRYRPTAADEKENLRQYRFQNQEVDPRVVVFLVVVVVAIRSYMGYGIPTSWNQSTLQSVLLYSFMGIGKAVGGVVTDHFGARKTAVVSTVCALPFLLFGDRIMLMSLVGIMLFSMTMAITLGVVVSILPDTPGFAFGLTTVGLALGTLPVFFYRPSSFVVACILVGGLTILSLPLLLLICAKNGSGKKEKLPLI